MESLANLVYQRQLSLGEQIVALLVVAIFGLARVAGDGDDGFGAVLGTIADEGAVDGGLLGLTHTEEPVAEGGRILLVEQQILVVHIVGVIGIKRRVEVYLAVVQSLDEGHGVGLVDISGAASVGIKLIRTQSEERHLVVFHEGQRARLGHRLLGSITGDEGRLAVLEQHHALGGSLACQHGVGLEVGSEGGFDATIVGCAHNVSQHTPHIVVDFSHRQRTFLHAVQNILHLLRSTAHEQVVAGMYLCAGVACLHPVGHNDAVEAPFLAQQVGEQLVAVLGVQAIDTVV